MKDPRQVLFKAKPEDLLSMVNELKILNVMADEAQFIIKYALQSKMNSFAFENIDDSYMRKHIAKYREIEQLRIRKP